MSKMYDPYTIKWVWVEGISGITSNTAYRIACDLCDIAVHPGLNSGTVSGKYLFNTTMGGDLWYDLKHVPVYEKILMRIEDNENGGYEFYRAQYPEWTKWSYYVAPMNEDEQFRMNDGVVEYRVMKNV